MKWKSLRSIASLCRFIGICNLLVAIPCTLLMQFSLALTLVVAAVFLFAFAGILDLLIECELHLSMLREGQVAVSRQIHQLEGVVTETTSAMLQDSLDSESMSQSEAEYVRQIRRRRRGS